MSSIKVRSALISVYDKTGLEPIISQLAANQVEIYSTGGTQKFIEGLGVPVKPVEGLTSYPSILDGRVKTLHPKVFGGILARREESHLQQLEQYEIPEIDLVIVDLYPFEETLKSTSEEEAIIEKIDIGGIALIRAAAKNFNDVAIVPSKNDYAYFLSAYQNGQGATTLQERKQLAARAFMCSSHYDTAIFQYFDQGQNEEILKMSFNEGMPLRYGENPHQKGKFYGDLDAKFTKLGGKALSFNNLVDIDAGVQIMSEFKDDKPSFAILKHTNACGVATRDNIFDAYTAALAGDPVSAFGGILIANTEIDLATAEKINTLFYEVLIAPSFSKDASALLLKKTKRVLLQITDFNISKKSFKSILNGVIAQDMDQSMEKEDAFTTATDLTPTSEQIQDLIFANKCAKHLKSNTIVLAKGQQLLGMGCGQTSRVDACNQAIAKAQHFGFDLEGAVLASDAFFPFPDCVEIAAKAGIKAILQPGGSIKDQLSIDYCNENNLPMVFTGTRHFKH